MKGKHLKVLALVLAMLFTVAAVGCGGSSESGDKSSDGGDKKPIVIRIGTTVTPTHSYSVVAKDFEKEVEEKTNGAIDIQYLGGGVLGGERQMVEAIQRGDLEMTWTSDIGLAAVYPELGFVNLPYLFPTYEDVDRDYINGWVAEYMTKFCDEKGIKILGYGENDFRAVTNSKHPITKGSDFKGLKLRVPETPMYVDFYESLGVACTPMAITEVPTALQQKTVDGQDNGAIMTYDYGLYKFQKYATRANQIYSGMQMCMGTVTWDKLTPEQQQIIAEASKKAAAAQVKLQRENAEKQWKEMADAGMEVIEITPELEADFKAIAERMYKDPKYSELYGEEIMAKIQEVKGIK
ncbi:MAG TPA: TRAP transporter substrate-binding protein [Syntrophomonadaceae bacterium]|nr:TRAP transporter substrate-binding protein [Syntrophomonadaceae bacterium]HQE23441.1 TRAP transporter substrate-binding protein [Syntrophomonadaceae bacterium]